MYITITCQNTLEPITYYVYPVSVALKDGPLQNVVPPVPSCLSIVPVIGFERTIYSAVEDDTATTEVCARVFDPPSLDRTVTVTLQTRDGSAVGMYLMVYYIRSHE